MPLGRARPETATIASLRFRLASTRVPAPPGLCFAGVLMVLAGSLAAQGHTFTRDVAPILQARCQECHRPGEAGPFSLLTYEQARPWAKAIRAAVLQRKMPPWFADPHYGK